MITVAVEDIDANPFNDREMVDLEQLADSIRETGLLSPVTLIRRSTFAEAHPEAAEGLTKDYVLGPGEHRWRASMLAEQKTIRGILRDDLAPKIRGVLLLENVYRTDPSAMEKARQINDAMEKDGLSIREAARILKMGPTSVHKLTELLKLPADAAEAVHRGTLVPTHARRLLTLDDPQSVSDAFQLMEQRGLKVEEAIRLVLAGERPVVTDDDQDDESDSDAETAADAEEADTETHEPEPAVPAQTRVEGTDERPAPDSSDESEGESQDEPEPAAVKSPPIRKSPKATATGDPHAAVRDIASADRDAACWSLLQRDEYASAEQVAGTMARALLVPFKQEAARAKAHVWLRKANRLGFDVSNADAYHQAVLSSRDPELIARVTFATALAASEIRAADRRRRTWDQHDAAHVQLLIQSTGYVPETDWEVAELKRHNVSVPEKQPTEG
ncbi:ParB/RepB/Spo0J family partition protein [[Kitasatospora] papulosa]|uniref:ParB/RepB/Spo0J family partition protein n=1 Tax=Streptomyces TaxID=1883 RepID=UPI00331DDA53